MKIRGKSISIAKLKEGKTYNDNLSEEAFYLEIKRTKIKKGFIHLCFRTGDPKDRVKLLLVSSKMKVLYNFDANTDTYMTLKENFSGRLMIKISGAKSCTIEKLVIENASSDYLLPYFENDNLLVSPGYPCNEDRYNCGFVHTRALAYKKEGFGVDVVWANDNLETTVYDYEGIRVIRMNYGDLRELLYLKKYKRILVHFFNEKTAKVFDNLDLSETLLYFYAHGAETLYRDWPKICCQYFHPTVKLNEPLLDMFEEKDRVIEKYNAMPNVKWIFVTEWTKKHSEELLGIKYNNYDVIACLIDTDTFKYEKRDPELRKKIFMLRKFHDFNSYSIDLDVRAILELSRRECFSDLEFNIYGDGPLHEMLLAPVKDFPNVHIHKRFLTADEIAQVHKENGIALFASRYDSQAVSSCEAASSGCVVVSTLNPGILQEFDAEHGTLCNQENHNEYADVIERLYYNPDEFLEIGKKMSDKIKSIYDYDHTIKREFEMFASDGAGGVETFELTENSDEPILSVIIPAYNVQKYIKHTIWSLVNQKNAGKLEILVINDGSKDDTYKTALDLAAKIDKTGKIIKVIDKENGGHGSVLNVGVEMARGKYLKVVDGDDTVNSKEFEKLIDILDGEDCDIVMNNFCEDVPYENRVSPGKYYSMLSEGVKYHIEDLCFDNYGFNVWGPLLSTSTYKLEMIKRRPFVTTEKMPYDDMEWNLNICINCETVKFYDLDVYNYLLGRAGQSISDEALKRNYPKHRQIVANLLKIYQENYDNISPNKRALVEKMILIKMIFTHYNMIYQLIKSPKAFKEFDDVVKPYPYFYNHPEIAGRKTRLLRLTNGHFMFLQNLKTKKNKNAGENNDG